MMKFKKLSAKKTTVCYFITSQHVKIYSEIESQKFIIIKCNNIKSCTQRQQKYFLIFSKNMNFNVIKVKNNEN